LSEGKCYACGKPASKIGFVELLGKIYLCDKHKKQYGGYITREQDIKICQKRLKSLDG